MTKKTEGKVTKAGSVELEEKDLDDVQGGGFDTYLKLDGIDGEVQLTDPNLTDYKIESGDDLTQKVSPTIKTTSLKR